MRGVTFFMAMIFFIIVGCGSSGPNIKEGKWQITSKVETTGAPFNFSLPEQTYTACLKSDDAIPLDEKSKKDENCKVISKSIKGDTVDWVIECNVNGQKVQNEGRVTYRGDTMEGEVKMSQMGMTITTKLKGKRVGDCDK